MELIQLIADWSCIEWHTTKNILPGVVVIRVRQKRPHSVANKRMDMFPVLWLKRLKFSEKKAKTFVFVRYSHNNKLRKRVFFSSEKRKTVDGLNIGVIGWKQPLSQPFLAVIKLKQLNSAANKEENVFGDINLK